MSNVFFTWYAHIYPPFNNDAHVKEFCYYCYISGERPTESTDFTPTIIAINEI